MSEASLSITNSKRTRTFTGCLTCRRRKVKCPGPALPCRACSRLQLECRSPFSKNLRSSNIASRQLVPTKATAVSHNQCHYTQGLAPEPLSPCTSILSPSARSDVTTGLPAVIPDVVSPDEWAATAQQWDDSRHALLDQSLFFDPLAPPRDAQNVFTFPSPGNLPNSQESWALDQADFVLDERYTTETDSSDSNRQALSLGMPLDICLPDESAPALVYFKGHLTTLLSVKNAQWNIFAHFLGRQHRKSPIGSSIIALAAAHQGLTLQNVSNEYLTHYGQASADLEHLLTSFESTGQIPPEHLEMVLATIYFLSHCEIVACDTFKIASRLKRIGALISAQWPSLRSTLTGISARLLLWLAYLDVRVSVLQDRAEIGSEPLLSTISRLNGLPRLYLSSRLYLKEAFGRHYPSSELQHDMVHDPVNMKYAEAMDTLGRVIRYARGVSDETHHSMLNRTTELEDLHSKLLDLEEECDLAMQGFDLDGSIVVTRTSYHWLSLKTVNSAGIILLDRVRNPGRRTSTDAQRAASEILRIAMKLKKANKLHNPHSVFSLLPVFLAGVETTDEIYQDWVKQYLKDASNWGLHAREASRLLQCVLEVQDQTQRRLPLENIARLATTPLVL